MGRSEGWGPENGHLLVNKTQLVILAEQRLQRRLHLLAIWTAVIEELDNGDVTLRVAPHRRRRIVEDLVVTIAEHLVRLGLLARPQRVEQDVGILHHIIVDDRLDRLALFGAKLGRFNRAKRHCREKCAGQSQGRKRRAEGHVDCTPAGKGAGRDRRGQRTFVRPPPESSICSASRWIFSARLYPAELFGKRA